jgi:S-formylglutathione hydrolase FrmB
MLKSYMKKFYLIVINLLIYSSVYYAQGTYFQTSFFSSALNEVKNVNVYLPPGYNLSDTTRYPVIYYLHGAQGDHNSSIFIIDSLNSLIASERISPVILVKPDGSAPPYYGSFYTNSILYGNFEDYITVDLISFIDSSFRTKASKFNRAIMGHSMGGFGAMKLAFKHTGKFAAAASHSGPLDFNKLPSLIPMILNEAGGGPPYNFTPQNGPFTGLGFSMAGAFSPNLSDQYFVDFLLDTDGNVIDSIFTKWKEHNPAKLAAGLSGNQPYIYFDCGTLDEIGLYQFNTAFRDTLSSLQMNFTFASYFGFHSLQLNRRIPVSLQFLDTIINSSLIPVELIAFTGEQNNNNINLSWTTATEVNNKGFEIQRKNLNNPGGWEIVSFIPGYGTTSEPKNYFYSDTNLPEGIYRYKLVQIDFDGTRNEKKEIEINLTRPLEFVLHQNYPNPFNPTTKIKYTIPRTDNLPVQPVQLKIYDILGNEVTTLVNEVKEPGEYVIEWNAENYSSGIYFYKLKSDNFSVTKKLILIK